MDMTVYILFGASQYEVKWRLSFVAPSPQEPTVAECCVRIESVWV